MSDLMLLEQAKLGREEAFSELLRRHKTSLFYFILQIVHNYWDAEDVLMESFAKAFTKLHTYTVKDTAKFRTWLFEIAKNHSVDHLRHQNFELTTVEIEDQHSFRCSSCTDDMLIYNDCMVQIQKAVSQLKPIHQQIYHLYVEGMKYKEIADELGLPLGTVQSYIFRIRTELKKTLL